MLQMFEIVRIFYLPVSRKCWQTKADEGEENKDRVEDREHDEDLTEGDL